jgi:hypothetical protein
MTNAGKMAMEAGIPTRPETTLSRDLAPVNGRVL